MNRKFSLILLLVCALGFALGITRLFKLRFETGDVYPPYSSLRFDPLGASALYESLGQVPGISVSRDYRMTDQLPEGKNIAYLHLAGRPEEWRDLSEESFKEIESFVKRGGRLVVALFPQTHNGYESAASRQSKKEAAEADKKNSKEKDAAKSKPAKSSKKKKKLIGGEFQSYKTVSLPERWGIGFELKELKPGIDTSYESLEVQNDQEPSLPESIFWHSGLVMTNLTPDWRVIYARDGEAVLVERKFGSGSVVFATDSYFLSNEALEKDRHAELLAWVVGPARQVVFDEAHLGIVDNPGVATLVRKYRLHGLVAGLLLLAGLFIWKNSISFVPALEEEKGETFVTGKDSGSGFVNLLRRHINSRDLLNTCLAEWKKSFPRGKASPARLERIESLIQADNARSAKERNPVRTYQSVCRVLKEGSEFRVPGSEFLASPVALQSADSNLSDKSNPAKKEIL